jgi:membrane glycosyltransferase
MKEIIDLYSKILIGTFSFIGPSFTLLIPIYYKAMLRSNERHIETVGNLYNVFLDMKKAEYPGMQQRWLVDDYRELLGKYKKEMQLLNPIRQIRRLFVGLFLAITFVSVYHFLHSIFSIGNSRIVRVGALCLSAASFCYCLAVLWQIFCTLVRVKADDSSSFSTPLKSNLEYGKF